MVRRDSGCKVGQLGGLGRCVCEVKAAGTGKIGGKGARAEVEPTNLYVLSPLILWIL
jgi:hypothetical protein